MRDAGLTRGYLYVMASAVIFGCMPLAAKLLYAEGVTPASLVFLRNALSLPVLALLGSRQGRRGLRIGLPAAARIGGIGLVGCGVTPVLLFTSYRFIASGTAAVFHFVYPAVVVLFSALILREPGQRRRLLCVLLCTLGVLLFYDPANPVNLRGGALALLSGVTYAAYILLLAHSRDKSVSGFTFSFYVSSACAAATLVFCLAAGQLAFPSTARGWALSLLFSLALCVGALVLFQQGTFLIGGNRAAILSTFEPITSVFVGILVFHEALTLRTAAGSVLVLLAAALIASFDRAAAPAS